MCRLDFILTSDNLQGYVKYADIVPGFRSDHSCTTITLSLDEPSRGKGYWKFNNSLTKDEELKKEIKKTIEETLQDNPNTEDGLMWDLIKCKIRGTCLMYASRRNKRRKNRLKELETHIKELEETVQNCIISGQDEEEINKKEQQLRELTLERKEYITEVTRGEALRSKALWHEEGNTSSKLFLNMEKSRGEQKTIRRLRSAEGKLITDRQEILDEEERFYQKLYTKELVSQDKNRITEQILNTEGPSLAEEDVEGLTDPFTEQEIWNIIKENPQNKSPGTDGLTNEFYAEYWPLIKDHLLKSINMGLLKGKLNTSQRRGVISLIPKPQKDLEHLKNWRPITLLNCDYKLLTKGIANRVKKILPSIISDDQGGFVKGRYIGCNIQRLQNLINICDKGPELNILTNIDFEKAFDTIHWDFIYRALRKLKFPEKLISWVKCIYNDIETCVMNNGFTTKFFKPKRGVRQGCPLSPYLFIISTEIMNRWLKEKLTKHGVKDKKGNNYLISQFADDTSFAIGSTKKALDDLFEHLEKYGEATGLKINIAKTEILLLGQTEEQDVPKRYRKHIKEYVRYLGCDIYKNHQITTEKNIEAATNKIKSLLDKWNRRHIALSGRIAVIKSILLPQLTYILTTMASPSKETLKDINQMFFKFINKGGSEKIKRKILIGDYSTGGYRMTDLASYIKAIKIRWMERFIKIPGIWKKEMENICQIDLQLLSRCNIKYKDIPFINKKYGMWDEILKEWCEENYQEVNNIDEIMQQCIWFNSHIKIQKKVVLWKKWEKHGIKWIADLLEEDNDGNLSFLSREEMEECYDIKISHMDYNSILSAIPREWKRTIRTRPHNIEEESSDTEDYKLIDQLQDSKT
jgi:hypothetical protein